MRKTRKEGSQRKGKVFLQIEIDPKLRDEMHLVAHHEGKTLKEWFPGFVAEHLPKLQIVSAK